MVVHTFVPTLMRQGDLKFKASVSYKSLSQKIKAVNGVQPGSVSVLNKVKRKESAWTWQHTRYKLISKIPKK